MDRLYAPWREAYVGKEKSGKGECPFCLAAASSDDASHHVLDRGGDFLVMLNRFPYNSGHLLIVPTDHIAELEAASSEVRAGMMEAVAKWSALIKRALGCHGFNIGFNIGEVSGGSIPGHLHMHVVPRWRGDTNFLTTIGQTKLISCSLDGIYRQLLAAAGQKNE